MEKLQKLFIKGKLAAASDGSAHVGKKASFAYCLAKKKKTKLLYKAHSPALVDPEYASSDRAELLGILGVVTKIQEMEQALHTSYQPNPIELFTDSQSSITILQKRIFPSTKNAMTSNMDVILEIQSQVKDMKTKIVFTHVKSHQDEHVPIKELPIRAQLNVKMDKLAEKQYNFSINEHYKKMPHLPAQQISFSSPWYRLTNNMESEFSRSRRDFMGGKEAL